MKKIFPFLFLFFALAITLSSCNDITYATELKNEKILIQEFIKRNKINVITELPADSTIWNENDYYYNEDDGLYFHLINPGVGAEVETNDVVVIRFKQYTLAPPLEADTVNNWTTIDSQLPTTFVYGNDTEISTAFQEAASYMKRNDSEAKIIVPSKINFETFWDPATPMGYDIKIRIQK